MFRCLEVYFKFWMFFFLVVSAWFLNPLPAPLASSSRGQPRVLEVGEDTEPAVESYFATSAVPETIDEGIFDGSFTWVLVTWYMGFSENVVYPIFPTGFLMIIIPTKWQFHWGIPYFQTCHDMSRSTRIYTSCFDVKNTF